MATRKDVRVKVRLNVLSVLLRDKGDADLRPPRQGSQRKTIIDVPEIEMSMDELETRLEHAQMVLETGYWVDPDDTPPQAVTDDAEDVTHNSVTLKGHVKSGTALIAAACGFQYGLTKELGSTHTADESPVMSALNTEINYALGGLAASTKYYYRVYATDANYSGGMYGIIKSFTTDATPV